MAEPTGGEQTLPASPFKKAKQREQGNVAKSQDLTAAITLLTALFLLRITGDSMIGGMMEAMRHYLGDGWALRAEVVNPAAFTLHAFWFIAKAALPFMALLALVGILANVLQFGLLFAPMALMPKPERLNPITGFKKFFSARAAVELVKSVLKLGAISWVVYATLHGRWDEVLALSGLTPWGATKAVGYLVFLVWLRVSALILLLGVFDYGFQRWQYERDLRMTTQEAREEMRQLEGDPKIKQRIRQIQRQMAMQRMMKEVPKADVIITNPTTYAVALRYEPNSMAAPTVVAKGARLLADRIRAIAIENGVPIVERPELARTLYKTLEVGRPVPEALFRAVAEVLAFVYQVDRRAEKIRERAQAFSPSAGAAM